MRTAGELAEFLGANLSGDAAAKISGVASPARATTGDLIYADGAKHLAEATSSAARCVVVREGTRINGKTTLEVRDAKLGFAKAASFLLERSLSPSGVHPTAIVAAGARIAPGVSVGPFAVIEESVEIGENSFVGPYCFLGEGAQIGRNCRLHPRVTVYAGVKIGDGSEVHAGTVLGAPGFGYVYGDGRHWKFPQVGGLEIGNDVEIGANTTIDRGSLETTQLAEGVKVDNLVQIAHNVRVGEHTVIASQTGISGSSVLGKMVLVGGQVGIADHCEIEDEAILGAQAGIPTGKRINRGRRFGEPQLVAWTDSRSSTPGSQSCRNWPNEFENWKGEVQANKIPRNSTPVDCPNRLSAIFSISQFSSSFQPLPSMKLQEIVTQRNARF